MLGNTNAMWYGCHRNSKASIRPAKTQPNVNVKKHTEWAPVATLAPMGPCAIVTTLLCYDRPAIERLRWVDFAD